MGFGNYILDTELGAHGVDLLSSIAYTRSIFCRFGTCANPRSAQHHQTRTRLTTARPRHLFLKALPGLNCRMPRPKRSNCLLCEKFASSDGQCLRNASIDPQLAAGDGFAAPGRAAGAVRLKIPDTTQRTSPEQYQKTRPPIASKRSRRRSVLRQTDTQKT